MTEIKDIAKSMLKMTDGIVRLKVQNPVVLTMYNRLILPFFKRSIDNTPDKEIVKQLQYAYDEFKPYFEKKQMKDMIDEADKLSDNMLSKNGLLKKESKYF